MLPGWVLPDEAQRLKTEADIQAIIEQGHQVTINPDGSAGTELPVHPVKTENFPVAKQVLQRYICAEHFELRVENPTAWIGLAQYFDELSDGDMNIAKETAARQLQVNKGLVSLRHAAQPTKVILPARPARGSEQRNRGRLTVASATAGEEERTRSVAAFRAAPSG